MLNPETPIPHHEVRPPNKVFNAPTIKVIKYCPLCGGTRGYTDAGKVDGMQMYTCRLCLGLFPKEAN